MSIIKDIIDQVLPAKPKVKLTKKCLLQAQAYGLTQDAVLDAFNHGEQVKDWLYKVRKFPTYTIGVSYFRDAKTGDYILSSVRKKQ